LSTMTEANASVLLVDALDIARAFELVHERTVDEIFDADFRDFRIDLRQKYLQALHAFEARMRRPS
jgi:hypothetical protein